MKVLVSLCLLFWGQAMSATSPMTKVGVAVLIFNKQNQVLLGLRQGSHGAGLWHTPGGHLEFQESIATTAKRETLEEIGVKLMDISHMAVTNDVFKKEGKHYITIIVAARLKEGAIVKNLEPEKCREWKWFDLNDLPDNLFPSLDKLFKGQVMEFNHSFYKKILNRKNPF